MSAPMWMLQPTEPTERESLTFRLLPGAVRTIGRAPPADFIVEATLISRLHCRLTVTAEGELAVEDLGSTNGTFVNGRRVGRAVLVAGDRLGLGRLELVVARTGNGEPGTGH